MFALLGTIAMGLDPKTGPTALSEKLGNSFARHDVIRGKPVLQDIGRELNTIQLSFFFDETFCDPETEWTKLYACYFLKEPLPFVFGGTYDGRTFVIETLEKEVQKTSRSGRVVRVEAKMSLIEAPVPDLLDALFGAAAGSASASGTGEANPETRQ